MKHIGSGRKEKRASGILIAGALFCLDQSVKRIFSGSDRYYCNPDGPWGVVAREEVILLGSAFALFAFGLLFRRPRVWKEAVALALIFGGGVSNLLDRVAYGCVRDFMLISGFPAFNLADVLLVLGASLLLTAMFSREKGKVSTFPGSPDASD